MILMPHLEIVPPALRSGCGARRGGSMICIYLWAQTFDAKAGILLGHMHAAFCLRSGVGVG